jgi:hypothetical protein
MDDSASSDATTHGAPPAQPPPRASIWRSPRARRALAIYWIGLALLGALSIVAAGGGHGVMWPVWIWGLATLPTSFVALLVARSAHADVFWGLASTLAAYALIPLVNALVWLAIIGLYRRIVDRIS